MLKKVSKIILKTFLWMVGIFIFLDFLIVTLLFVPPVQQFAVLKVSKFLTNITGGEITVDKIFLSPTLRLTAKNFAIKDHHLENMIFASKLTGRINISRTGKGQMCLSFAKLNDGEVVLRKYAGEDTVNIAKWARGFKKEEKKEPKFKLLFENINLNNVRFVFINDDKRLYKEDNTIDYGFFELQNIHLDVDDFLVFGPDISCRINSLTLKQHTGFEISSFSGNFRIYNEGLIVDSLKFTTPNSTFSGDFAFRYNEFKDYGDFVNKINFDTQIKSAAIDMKDVICFAPALAGMENKYVVSGQVDGTVNQLKTKNIYLKYRLQTIFAGDFAINNTLDAQNRSFDVNFRNANVNFSDLEHFKLPKGKTISIPNALKSIAYLRINGKFRGSFTKFSTNLSIQTNLGAVDTQISTLQQGAALSYSGTVACSNVEIGKLLNMPKYLNKVSVKTTLEGAATNTKSVKDLLSSISINYRGRITHFDLCNYPLSDVIVSGKYSKNSILLAVRSRDSLAKFSAEGKIDLSKAEPKIQSTINQLNIELYELFSHFNHQIDTATANGFDKLISKIQQAPKLALTIDSLSVLGYGRQLENFNGFLGIDNANLTDGKKTSRIDWFRLAAINLPRTPHHYQIRSNAFNLSLKTNYDLKDFISAIRNTIQFYIPEMFSGDEQFAETKEIISQPLAPFIDIDLQLYYTRNLLGYLLPKLNIARDGYVNIRLGKTRNEDIINVILPRVTYTDTGSLYNLKLDGQTNAKDELELSVYCDSVAVNQKKSNLTFSKIGLQTNNNKEMVQFAVSWVNPNKISVNELNTLKGVFTGTSTQDLLLKITDSKLFVQNSVWKFIGKENTIQYGNKKLLFNKCVLASDIGKISVDGEISQYSNKECNILLEDLDISLLNSITSEKGITFGGNMSLMAIISTNIAHFMVEGRTFVKDFILNEEHLGDMFLDATMFANEGPHFMGGFLSQKERFNINLANFTYLDYLALPNRIVELSGRYITKEKELRVHANMDTLKMGFLSPFLAGFSDVVTGYAAGELDFIMKKDSLYFDGKVRVKNAQMGIKPLNTVYYIVEQDIKFNRKGIFFDNVEIKDKFNNKATLTGSVQHNKFKDISIDLNITTPKILALNTPKKVDASFYGDGFVSGDVSIRGDTKLLNFTGHNIRTQSGSSIIFPLSSASTVSSAQGIYFAQSNTNEVVVEKKKMNTELNFDFTFEITRDADVRLDLYPIDGVLRCKTEGRLRLNYNSSTENLNLDGLLAIVSGSFHMSLRNLFLRDFSIVEGGTIAFAGKLTSAQINVSALYQKAASLSSLSEDLRDIGRTDVTAYLGLTGNLMNPNPTFTFAFPRLTDGDKSRIFSVLDTTNTQNGIRQFFSFVFLNNFITTESNFNAQQQSIGTGIDFVSGILNSFISNQLNNFSIGVNYSDQETYREYSFDAAYSFLNNRGTIKTNFGYAENRYNQGESNNNLVGGVDLEFLLNPKGNLLFRAFYFNDKTGTNQDDKPQQGGGIGLTFKQSFNTRKDFLESWESKQKRKKQKK